MENRRYFVNDILKTRFSSVEVYGKPECLMCGYKLNLDIHHLYKYKKVKLSEEEYKKWKKYYQEGNKSHQEYFARKGIDAINWTKFEKNGVDKLIFLCLNHHQMFHRFVAHYSISPYVLSPTNDLNVMMEQLRKIESDNIPYYSKGENSSMWGFVYYSCNHKGKGGNNCKVSSLFPKKMVNSIPECFFCGYNLLLDLHHIHKESRLIFLCPNHHHMIHRHLGDMDGDKLTLKDIKEGIDRIEKEKKAYYKEVLEKEYSKYTSYRKIKERANLK